MSDADNTVVRTRRTVLTAGAASVLAFGATSVTRPQRADAASAVQLGTLNTATERTSVFRDGGPLNAVALVGRVTGTDLGGQSAGLQGRSDRVDGNGVIGSAGLGGLATGVWGLSSSGAGVFGQGPLGVGGRGDPGVGGYAVSENAAGVYGESLSGSDGKGVWGSSASGWAGYFDGNVFISGTLTGGNIIINAVDHPDAPATHWYQQAMVGSFERLTVISGNVRTGANGRATIRVPALFAKLHRDFRYQLTPLGDTTRLFVSQTLKNARFVIQANTSGLDVSWQVTGVRDDPSARAQPFNVDAQKKGAAAGRYLEPSLYGQSMSRSVTAPKPRAFRPKTFTEER